MASLKLMKKFVVEYRLTVILIVILSLLWKLGFLNNIGYDWMQLSFEEVQEDPRADSVRWKNSPLWAEDQKSHINPPKGDVRAKVITPPALGIHRNLEGVALPMIMIF